MGVLGPQAPASSRPPRCSQQHPCLSPGLSSAKMPGPAKPAVPVRHPCDTPPPPCSGFRKTWAQPEGRAVSRWVGGGLRLENRMDRVMLHPPACPTCPAHPCSFHPPSALGQGRRLRILLGMALPLWPRVPRNLLYQTSPCPSCSRVPLVHSATPTAFLQSACPGPRAVPGTGDAAADRG